MKLTKILHDQGYDLIEGPIRNHKLLQLWLKQFINEAELYYSHIDNAFSNTVAIAEIENTALNINATHKNEYGFNIGITLLEEALKGLGLAAFEISTKIKSGKTVTISYDNSITKECAIGNIQDYLATADFNHPNPALLLNANRNNILVITGVVLAKNLIVEIETDFSVDAALVATLNKVADGKLDFTFNGKATLKMVSTGNAYFPIAVKASRIDFDKSVFKKLTLITDTRNFF